MYQCSIYWFESNINLKICEILGEASNLANLTAMVLANYDPGLRPSCYGDERVNLDVNMAVRQLIILVR